MPEDQSAKWALYRQDDHGNRFLVGRYKTEELAHRAKRDLERYFHKQFYEVEYQAEKIPI